MPMQPRVSTFYSCNFISIVIDGNVIIRSYLVLELARYSRHRDFVAVRWEVECVPRLANMG